LKNVEYVVGIVVYTGHETKLMQNQGFSRNKKSHIEKQLNKYIFGVFIVQCLLCVILAIMATLFNVSLFNLPSITLLNRMNTIQRQEQN